MRRARPTTGKSPRLLNVLQTRARTLAKPHDQHTTIPTQRDFAPRPRKHRLHNNLVPALPVPAGTVRGGTGACAGHLGRTLAQLGPYLVSKFFWYLEI